MEGRISQPPERGGEIVIQQASDDCQAVLLHCRCDANMHSSFSSLRCVILLPVLPSAPSPSPFLSSFPLLVSPAVFLPCMPLLTLWAFLFLFLLLFIYLFTYLSGLPHSSFTPSFFFLFPSSQWRWVGGVKNCAPEIVVPSAFQTGQTLCAWVCVLEEPSHNKKNGHSLLFRLK